MNRRQFLQRLGVGAGSALAMMAMEPLNVLAGTKKPDDVVGGDDSVKMTYRVQHGSGEKISLLGFGMMRLPDDQEDVDRLVDYAIAHGVNYFDTAPMYKGGRNEDQTGRALSRYPRDKYYIATKMSNQNQRLWDFDAAKEMYERSFERLRVDYIDYYLLHSIGGGGVDGLKGRFLDNGLLHASLNKNGWRRDADAEYLYDKLEKTGVQAVIMEPLRGGALGKMNDDLTARLKAVRPNDSPASWAFRWVASHPNILTTLSGINQMEHMEENIRTFSPLEPCTEAENVLLAEIADVMAGFPTIPCTTCSYCMPCPFGVDIPGNFAYYNDAVSKQILPLPDKTSADYLTRKQQFADGLLEALPDKSKWANQCTDCEACLPKCPQQIRIPNQMARIVETLSRR